MLKQNDQNKMNTLDDTYQMMIVNAACHAIAMNQETERMAIGERMRPATLYRPKLSIDGNQWCALYGENLQDGVAGFGNSPDGAMRAFDVAWFSEANDTAHKQKGRERGPDNTQD
jgi:hypothetical protein